MTDAPEQKVESRASGPWLLAAIALVIATGFVLRFGSSVLTFDSVKDEYLMKKPIDDILERGWSVETAIDYQEVKGPAFYWTYAAGGEVLGGDINSLRLISVLCFVLAAVPLLLMAQRVGISGPGVVAVAGLWSVLPYNAYIGQLLFSEPSFLMFAMWLCWAFVWGFGNSPQDEQRIAGPILFAILLSMLLHHRPHAVAFAGAAALTACQRDRIRSWPWWLACLIAGLTRLPLWAHWGGLVTWNYQQLFGFGFQPDNFLYALAACLPWTALLIWPAIVQGAARSRTLLVAVLVVTIIVGMIFTPDLTAKRDYFHPELEQIKQQDAFAGTIATAVRTATNKIGGSAVMQTAVLSMLGGLGAVSIAAFGQLALRRRTDEMGAHVLRLAFWTLAVGLPLYAITRGPMYDRYLMVWAPLLPLAWWRLLPRWLLIVQAAGCLAVAAYHVNQFLLQPLTV